MNFLLKIALLLISPIYIYATCSLPETNISNPVLRLAHYTCPKLFITDPAKEKYVIDYYDNDYTAYKNGNPISLTLDGEKITQPWIDSLAKTVLSLRDRINLKGKFNATSSGGRLTKVEAKEGGYKIDPIATGGTPMIKNQYRAEVNDSWGTTLYKGSEGTKEKAMFDLNASSLSSKINFSKIVIRNVELSMGTEKNSTSYTGNATVATETSDSMTELMTKIKLVAGGKNFEVNTSDTSGEVNITNKDIGNAANAYIKLEYNTSVTVWAYAYVGTTSDFGTLRHIHGTGKKKSKRRVYYYGNEGNYSIKFWPKDYNLSDMNNSNSSAYTIETPYITNMSTTLNKLKKVLDTNLSYTSTVSSYNGVYYLQLEDKTARATKHLLSGKSGNGRAKIDLQVQGQATPTDINMTSMSYNDNFLYTTFDVLEFDDVNISDGNYSDERQNILEIFEVTHIFDRDNAASNTIDLTSVRTKRYDNNLSSIVSGNDIVFLGDDNSSYYKFSRISTIKKLTDVKKVEEPNEIENVKANMTEHYQDGVNAYVFLADDSRMRVYKVDNRNEVTHYVTYSNFGGTISDINKDGKYIYVQSNQGNRLTKFIILKENTYFSIERVKTFVLDANKVYVRGDYIYYTRGNDNHGMQAKIGNTVIENEETVEANEVAFMVGDEFYSASIGMDGLKIYDYNRSLNSADNAFSGSKIIILGEFIITDDLNSSQIRVYKFGDWCKQ